MKILFIMLFFYFLFLFLFLFYKKNEYFNASSIIFLTKEELNELLTSNFDKYYDTFTEKDLFVRKIKSKDDYNELIYNYAISELDENQKKKVILAINKADKRIRNIKYQWFNGEKAIKIPWKIGYVHGKIYEYGLPHTRGDVIILSDIERIDLIDILIHEKVHIYQKMFQNDVNLFIEEYGFKKIMKRSLNDNIHANPDVDNWVYCDKNGNIYNATYNQNNPSSFQDITYYPENMQQYEHPFEKMAIIIAKK